MGFARRLAQCHELFLNRRRQFMSRQLGMSHRESCKKINGTRHYIDRTVSTVRVYNLSGGLSICPSLLFSLYLSVQTEPCEPSLLVHVQLHSLIKPCAYWPSKLLGPRTSTLCRSVFVQACASAWICRRTWRRYGRGNRQIQLLQ